jgi:DNA-binding MarR family transcriptional regulator
MKTSNENIEKIRVGYVVGEYGEILNEIYEGDKIVRQEQDEYKKNHIIGFKKKEAFVKVFTNPITALFKELPTKEFAVTMALMPFISYNDGILRYNNKIVDGKAISELLGENYETFKRIIASLIKKNILARIDRPSDTYSNKTKKCLVVNPFIFLRGQDIEKDIVDLFVDSKWANLEK